jgi:UDP-2,4-diacetamido-2,4,6-trideoxy-beta-L-altropyranose hydrolase
MRCLTLAGALAGRGWRCAFIANAEAEQVVPLLARQERVADFTRADLLVVDHYGLDAAYETAARGRARAVMAIDDLADRRHDADFLLDQTLARDAHAYRGLVPPGCTLLLGAEYALLRPEFARARAAGLRARAELSRVLVSLGATDPDNATGAVLDAIAASGLGLEIDVVVGASNRHQSALARANARLHVNPPGERLVELMSGADLAIGSGGISAYERCCLGLPSLLVVLADNQAGNAEALRRAGAALPMSIGALRESLLAMKADALQRMSRAAAAVCDGLGAVRAADALGRTIK